VGENEAAMSDALDVIRDEASRLLNEADIPEAVVKGLELIESIARYKMDVRSQQEREQ
jgi:hypothetical protein